MKMSKTVFITSTFIKRVTIPLLFMPVASLTFAGTPVDHAALALFEAQNSALEKILMAKVMDLSHPVI